MANQPFPSYDFRVWDSTSPLPPDLGDVYAASDGAGPVTAIGLVRGRQDPDGSWSCVYSYGSSYSYGSRLPDYANAVVSRFMEILVDDTWDGETRRRFIERLDGLTVESAGEPTCLLLDGVEVLAHKWSIPQQEGWIISAEVGEGGVAVAGFGCPELLELVPADPGIWGSVAEGAAKQIAL